MAPLEGPVSVGALIDAILFGCVLVQSCVYYKNAKGDAWLLKALVFLILILSLSHLVCMTVWLWVSVEESAENASLPQYATTLSGVYSICGAIIVFLERCFFSHRVMKLSNNHMLGFIFFVGCVFSFTTALGEACVFFSNSTADLTGQLGSSWIFPFVILSGLVCDLAINVATTVFLADSHTRSEAAEALGRAGRLPFWVAETSAVTSIFGVAVVVVYWSTRASFAWVGLLVAMPGVFANALLVALNARGYLRAEIEHQRIKIGDNLVSSRVKKPPIIVAISRKVEKQSDEDPV